MCGVGEGGGGAQGEADQDHEGRKGGGQYERGKKSGAARGSREKPFLGGKRKWKKYNVLETRPITQFFTCVTRSKEDKDQGD